MRPLCLHPSTAEFPDRRLTITQVAGEMGESKIGLEGGSQGPRARASVLAVIVFLLCALALPLLPTPNEKCVRAGTGFLLHYLLIKGVTRNIF